MPALAFSAGIAAEGNLLFQADDWSRFGAGALEMTGDSVLLHDAFIVGREPLANGQFSFEGQAPAGTEEVQIGAGFRCLDRDRRYVVALRGGNNNDVYLARYAPESAQEFLGVAPLGFEPKAGEWHRLRIVTIDRRILVFVDGETLPRINVVDKNATWTAGSMVLGGGWLPVRYRRLQVERFDRTPPEILAVEDRVTAPPGIDREALRQRQRATYRPVSVSRIPALRSEFSLDGNWLFMPDQLLARAVQPNAPDCDDRDWHILAVPAMWTPEWNWLHGERGSWTTFGKDVGGTKGVSDRYRDLELARVNGYTFDWQKTEGAWSAVLVLTDAPRDHSQ